MCEVKCEIYYSGSVAVRSNTPGYSVRIIPFQQVRFSRKSETNRLFVWDNLALNGGFLEEFNIRAERNDIIARCSITSQAFRWKIYLGWQFPVVFIWAHSCCTATSAHPYQVGLELATALGSPCSEVNYSGNGIKIKEGLWCIYS